MDLLHPFRLGARAASRPARASVASRLALTLALAALHYGAGRLGLLLAIPPGYATPVWPPAGVALAATLLFGLRAGPGIFLGALLLVLGALLGRGEPELRNLVLAPVLVGCGACLHAFLGARLLRSRAAFPNDLASGAEVARFLFYAGPVAALVNATWSGVALCALGLLPWTSFAFGWATWWCGDAIGALVITPIALIWKRGPRELRRRRRRLVAAPLVGVSSACTLVFFLLSQRDQRQIEHGLEERGDGVVHALQAQLQATVDALHAVQSFVATARTLDRASFAHFASDLVEHHTELAAVEWIPRVPRAERAAHEAAMRAEGQDHFVITELGPDGCLRPAGERDEYLPVSYVEPEPGNEAALGFDLGSEEVRRALTTTARSAAEILASPPLTLVQGSRPVEGARSGASSGVLLVLPVHGRDGQERPGFVLAVLRVHDLLRRALPVEIEGLEMTLVDVTAGGPEFTLHSAPPTGRSALTWVQRIPAGQRVWELRFSTPESFLRAHPAFTAWLVLAGGMLLTSALGGLLLVVTGRTLTVERLAHERALELRRQSEEHERAREQLRHMQKLEVVGRLAGGVAHDLNNLLTVIQGYDELLLADCGPESPGRGPALEIKKASERAAALVRRLLAFAKKQILQPQVIDVNELLGNLEGTLLPLIGARVTLRVHKRSRGRVEVDPGQLEQVVMNLVVNARDALLPQGGELGIETEDRTVASGESRLPPGRYVVLSVSDEGCGMGPEVVERMFEPFFTTKKEGTGLGLATVYGIVEQSGGHVAVDSRVGAGTSVRVWLPHTEKAPHPELRPEGGSLSTVRGLILLVEDEPALRELVAWHLSARGFTPLVAENGRAAVELARRHAHELELVLTDVVMPELTGPEVVAEIRRLVPHVAVLYMSGYAGVALGQVDPREPEADCLQKPFELEVLVRRVRRALRKRRALAA